MTCCLLAMPRRHKPGPRTKSGRPSRAYRGPARDTGTREFCAKRAYLINGSDPQLAASASGILLANGFLSRNQHAAALTYMSGRMLFPTAGPGGRRAHSVIAPARRHLKNAS
jgi:hypothetical protein